MSRKVFVSSLVAAVAVAWSVFVWPTKYKYTELRTGSTVMPVRINRFSGATDVFLGKWLVDAPPTSTGNPAVANRATPQSLPAEELAKLQLSWTKSTLYEERLELRIYNGTTYSIESVTVEVAA